MERPLNEKEAHNRFIDNCLRMEAIEREMASLHSEMDMLFFDNSRTRYFLSEDSEIIKSPLTRQEVTKLEKYDCE